MRKAEDTHFTRRSMLAALGIASGVAAVGVPQIAHALVVAPGGMFYPTDPWRYNGLEGTRYLDPRRDQFGNIVRYHMGIDSQGSAGSAIYSTLAGRVVDGSWTPAGGYGNTVVVDHGGGLRTRYAHFSSAPMVRLWDDVRAGQQVGRMGGSQNGGLNTLPVHLHFEVYRDGNNVDPLAFLAGELGTHHPEPEDDMFTDNDRIALQQVRDVLGAQGGLNTPTQDTVAYLVRQVGRYTVNGGSDVTAKLGATESIFGLILAQQAQIQQLTEAVQALSAQRTS